MAKDMPGSIVNRFRDKPFRDPNLPPEKVKILDERAEAMRIYYATGDPGPAQKAGLFPSTERMKEIDARRANRAAKDKKKREK